jgi:hypothetical protein
LRKKQKKTLRSIVLGWAVWFNDKRTCPACMKWGSIPSTERKKEKHEINTSYKKLGKGKWE